jgi:[amino group carrier protein]-L-2-aminoadipate 6-kinase
MIIIKIGGGESINITGIVEDLASIDERFMIVHGANALRDAIAGQIDIPKKVITSISGYSSVFSDRDAIDVMMMTYAGLKNKRIVETCQQHGINAVGLTGLDGQTVRAKRNRGIRVFEEGRKKIVRDFSGKPVAVNTDLLGLLVDHGYVPVLTVPVLDETGCAVNTENDEIVRVLQESLRADRVIQLIEAPGFLSDPADPGSLIERMTAADCAAWEERVEGRIKRKLLALGKLVEKNGVTVYIGDGRIDRPVRSALAGKGTVVECRS